LNILDKYHLKGLSKISNYIDAALVTKDPILFLGESGCGKTTTFSVVMKAMGKIIQSIDTSKVNPEELYGFPVPIKKDDGTYKMEFCETPLTVFGKNSLLFNELSRCRIETQNQILDILQERCVQGMPLEDLQYIWGDLNPIEYAGSEPLPLATARRFSAILKFPTYKDMIIEERLQINSIDINTISEDGEYIKYISKIEKVYLKEKDKRIYSKWRDSFLMELSESVKYSPNGRQAGFIDRFLAAVTAVNIVNGTKKNLAKIGMEVCFMLIPEMVSDEPIETSEIERAAERANNNIFNNIISDLGIHDKDPIISIDKLWNSKKLSNYEKSINLEIFWRKLADHQKNIISLAFSDRDDERINQEIAQEIAERLENLMLKPNVTRYDLKSLILTDDMEKFSKILDNIENYGTVGNCLSAVLSNNVLEIPINVIIKDFFRILDIFENDDKEQIKQKNLEEIKKFRKHIPIKTVKDICDNLNIPRKQSRDKMIELIVSSTKENLSNLDVIEIYSKDLADYIREDIS